MFRKCPTQGTTVYHRAEQKSLAASFQIWGFTRKVAFPVILEKAKTLLENREYFCFIFPLNHRTESLCSFCLFQRFTDILLATQILYIDFEIITCFLLPLNWVGVNSKFEIQMFWGQFFWRQKYIFTIQIYSNFVKEGLYA